MITYLTQLRVGVPACIKSVLQEPPQLPPHLKLSLLNHAPWRNDPNLLPERWLCSTPAVHYSCRPYM